MKTSNAGKPAGSDAWRLIPTVFAELLRDLRDG
jgi:hypothetical protein